MPSLQHIRRKIASIKSTQKITKAMKMVAAAKLKRAQDRILSARPYAQGMDVVLRDLSQRVNRDRYPLLKKREGARVELVVITADRGLCGAFNANILRAAQNFMGDLQAQGKTVSLTLIGRKARDYFNRRNISHRRVWVQIFDRLDYAHAAEIGRDLVRAYVEDTFEELFLLYNEFRSVMTQRVTMEKLLPIEPREEGNGMLGEFLFEPSEEEVLSQLLPRYAEVQVFRALLESSAGELGARMTAMDSASRNASELISKLTLVFNKTRQAAITKELMDIVGGAEALKTRT
jgi:F-type H+-transporting ATPase subunit gamma